nr:hypothetical protein [uncultured Psychroserpens sp.]
MIFNTILSAVKGNTCRRNKSNVKTARHQYIIDKYHERSVTNRYFR